LPIRLPACLSLDLDNKWSYLKSHGDPNWKSLPSYLNRIVPGILDVLDDLGIRITFFVVGHSNGLPDANQLAFEGPDSACRIRL
jgi:peptidoglycan/xylan/chitin deacetylase (PgdA/CDA1 family)